MNNIAAGARVRYRERKTGKESRNKKQEKPEINLFLRNSSYLCQSETPAMIHKQTISIWFKKIITNNQKPITKNQKPMKTIIRFLTILALAGTQACFAQKKTIPTKVQDSVLTMTPRIVYGYYDWTIETAAYTYSGTALTMENLDKIIELVAVKELIVGRKIVWIPIKRLQ